MASTVPVCSATNGHATNWPWEISSEHSSNPFLHSAEPFSQCSFWGAPIRIPDPAGSAGGVPVSLGGVPVSPGGMPVSPGGVLEAPAANSTSTQ